MMLNFRIGVSPFTSGAKKSVSAAGAFEPVEIGRVLGVGPGLDQLLGAAVQQADMRIDPLDQLTVQLEYEAQHAVGGRVLRTEVDVEFADRCLGGNLGRHLGFAHGAFSGARRPALIITIRMAPASIAASSIRL